MAIPKTGFSFYSVDTDRYQDIRIKRLKKSFGCIGLAVYDYVLCEIYRVKGCFLEWDENTAFDVADYLGIKESAVLEIVNYCGVVGLFHKELLTRDRVLTSKAIQLRYIDMCIRSKRVVSQIPLRLKIPEECEITPEECRKEEKSKVKKRIIPPLPLKGGGGGGVLFPFDEKSPVMLRIYETISDDGVRAALRDWVRCRFDDGQTLNEISIEKHLSDLCNLASEPAKQLKHIHEAIKRNWKAFYPLKEENPRDRFGPNQRRQTSIDEYTEKF